MQAILKFILPEETYEFEMAVSGHKYQSVLFELNNFLRTKLKHEDLSDPVAESLEQVRNKLNELMEEEEINF